MTTTTVPFLIDPHSIPKQCTIIVGLSGGPDSVCLLHALHALSTSHNLSLIAAHLDHGWRAESYQDVELCKQLCNSLSIPLIVNHKDQYAHAVTKTGSKEDEGRQLRQSFFKNLISYYPTAFVALAHHADDQQETFIMRIIRGTTITGLCCMKQRDGIFLRPLLSVPKKSILEYLRFYNLSFIQDSTNESDAFLRNRIRHHIIPAFLKTDARSSAHILTLIAQLQETEKYLQQHTKRLYDTLKTPQGLSLHAFRTIDIYMQKRIIVHWLHDSITTPFTLSSALIEEILRFLSSLRGGTHQLNPRWFMCKKKQYATLHSYC